LNTSIAQLGKNHFLSVAKLLINLYIFAPELSEYDLMEINTLYEKALHGGRVQEDQLFQTLTVRFRIIARHRVRNNEDAEDVVQETMAVICREFRNTAFHTSFAAWAYEVLRHRILAYYEKRNARGRESVHLDETVLNSEAAMNDEGVALRPSLIDCLRQIAGYNIRYARVLNLHHQGYSTDEICRKLRIKSGNFYLILLRARALLDKCLREKGYHGRKMQ
jgi:RNA polymerase sigma factor (sigma-70 family)